MSGLLALLDDVAAIAKVAATSLDDVVVQAAKAGSKAAGALIDDAAVTPKYLQGFKPARELPIIWRIAKGSLKNKMLYLVPAGMALTTFAPWMISPLLMLGGSYLCFEGAEKIWHFFAPHPVAEEQGEAVKTDPGHLEEERAAGAIKTDFVLSAEIMTIALAEIPRGNIWMETATLATVGVGITVLVYGSVALIVKADDVGLYLSRNGRLGLTRWAGRGLVRMMPGFMHLLANVGTAAMLWVGGSIVIHSADSMGFGWMKNTIYDLSAQAGALVPDAYAGAARWVATASLDGVLGLALGLVLIPVVGKVVMPLWSRLRGR